MDNINQTQSGWFPGHMAGANVEIEKKISVVDAVIEIRDARAPLSSGNSQEKYRLRQKKRIIVLNKKDLADPKAMDAWHLYFKRRNIAHLFITASERKDVRRLTHLTETLFAERASQFVSRGISPPPTRLMIVGIPNCGKSTLINTITSGKKAKVGAVPGITQKVGWYLLGKRLELLDTPGILPTHFESAEQLMKLCCTHTVRLTAEQTASTCDFLLDLLLSRYPQNLIQRYGDQLANSNTPEEVVAKVAEHFGCYTKNSALHLEKAQLIILKEYRQRLLGRVSLEIPEDFTQ